MPAYASSWDSEENIIICRCTLENIRICRTKSGDPAKRRSIVYRFA